MYSFDLMVEVKNYEFCTTTSMTLEIFAPNDRLLTRLYADV